MKRNYILVIVAILWIVGGLFLKASFEEKGDTIESREALLNEANTRGKDWTIYNETMMDQYLICTAYSTDNLSTIAVFKETKNGYKFSTATNRDSDEIIIGGAVINGEWYDFIWFNGAKTEQAKITYTFNGTKQEPLVYQTETMPLICIKTAEKDYSIHVAYYDSEGNIYE